MVVVESDPCATVREYGAETVQRMDQILGVLMSRLGLVELAVPQEVATEFAGVGGSSVASIRRPLAERPA